MIVFYIPTFSVFSNRLHCIFCDLDISYDITIRSSQVDFHIFLRSDFCNLLRIWECLKIIGPPKIWHFFLIIYVNYSLIIVFKVKINDSCNYGNKRKPLFIAQQPSNLIWLSYTFRTKSLTCQNHAMRPWDSRQLRAHNEKVTLRLWKNETGSQKRTSNSN